MIGRKFRATRAPASVSLKVAAGVSLELGPVTAGIIGSASLSGASGTVLGSVVGALIMSVLRQGSQQMGWRNYFQEIIIGLVIIVALFPDRFRRGGRARAAP